MSRSVMAFSLKNGLKKYSSFRITEYLMFEVDVKNVTVEKLKEKNEHSSGLGF